MTPEPRDKLDAMAVEHAAIPARADGMVNGLEDGFPQWTAVDWRKTEDDVRRLRQRIFTASKEGDLAKVRNRPTTPQGLLEPRCGESPLARF